MTKIPELWIHATRLTYLGGVMQAEGHLAGALAICEQALGTDHPSTRTVRDYLSSLGTAGG